MKSPNGFILVYKLQTKLSLSAIKTPHDTRHTFITMPKMVHMDEFFTKTYSWSCYSLPK
jgi:hypothetical protein